MANEIKEGWDLYPTGAVPTALQGAGWSVTSFINNVMSISTTEFANGRASLLIASNAGRTFLTRAIPNANEYSFGFRFFKISTNGNDINNALSGIRGTAKLVIGLNGTMNLFVARGTTVLYTSPVTYSLSTWYYVDAIYNRISGELFVYVNNTLLTVVSGIASIGAISNAFIGIETGTGNNHGSVYLDDMYWNSGIERWGDTAMILVKPSADLSPQDWTPSGGAAFSILGNAPYVNGSYIEAANMGDISNFEISDLPFGVYQVYSVDHVYRMSKTDAGAATVQASLVVNGVEYAGAANNPSQGTFDTFTDRYNFNPNTGVSWLITDFQGGNVGSKFERTV